MSGVELRELRYLVALADEGTFTRAAQRCWVTQQGFSKAIARLERRAGVALVLRRPRGSTLTPAGRRLVAAARAVLAEADALGAVLFSEPPTGQARRLRIGVLLDGLGADTPDLLVAFRSAHPDVAMTLTRVQPHELPVALVDGLVDLALIHGPLVDERVVVTALRSEARVAVVSRSDARADATALSTDDLLELPARARRPRIDPSWEGFFTLRAERNGEDPRRLGAPAGSFEELLWAISLDRLFLTVPEHLADTYPGPVFGVEYVPLADPVVFSVAVRRDDASPDVAAFVRLATAVSAGAPPQPGVVGRRSSAADSL